MIGVGGAEDAPREAADGGSAISGAAVTGGLDGARSTVGPVASSPRPARLSPRAALRLWSRAPARAKAGTVLATLVLIVTLVGPASLPYDPLKPDYLATYAAPSLTHPLGTDGLGRDVLARTLAGGRVSLTIASLAALLALTLGGTAGLAAAEGGARTDATLVRAFDALLAFPGFLLVLLVVAATGGGVPQTILALGLAGSPLYFRLVRGFARSARTAEHVTAARALGAGALRTASRHVLPVFAGPLAVQVASTLATFLLVEASLSYLGLGVSLPTPTWGNVLQDARALLTRQPWAALGPGVVLGMATLSLQLLADGLRDAGDVGG
ncbi:MAG: ABC transporter permease [Trueperaceae bacterium]